MRGSLQRRTLAARPLSEALPGVQVRSHAPEVLVVMQCGVSPQGVLACVTELAALPGWWGLPAVKNGCVYIVDHAPFLRPGPRVVRVTSAACQTRMAAYKVIA